MTSRANTTTSTLTTTTTTITNTCAVNTTTTLTDFSFCYFNHQDVAFKLAKMHTEIEAARYFCLKAAWLKDNNKPYGTASAMAKYHAAETAMHVTTEAVQIHGGYGYVREYHVERLMREAKLTQIYEGTSEIQLMIISRAIATA